jgi:hypothetical protein
MYSVLGHERAVEGSFILGLKTTIQVTNICIKDAREIQVTNKSIFMLLTILIALQFKDSKSYKTFSGPVTIYVTNNLTDNLQLGVDCKDKHSDFGYRIIHFKESYIFTVKPTPFIPTKLYFCSFS